MPWLLLYEQFIILMPTNPMLQPNKQPHQLSAVSSLTSFLAARIMYSPETLRVLLTRLLEEFYLFI